jgi:hypothetical protein
MSRFKQHPLFFALITAAALIAAVEIFFIFSRRAALRDVEAKLTEEIQRVERFNTRRPVPSEISVRRVNEDLDTHSAALSELLESLNLGGGQEIALFRRAPASRTEAFFDLANFVERMRRQADQAEVGIRPEERFGFSAFTNEGPGPDQMQAVYRQRRIMEELLNSLFAAQPRELVSVQRERPGAVANPAVEESDFGCFDGPTGGGRRPPRGGGQDSGDIFAMDPAVSARSPGFVDTMAFRFTFVGQTSSLRSFLNSVASSDLPLVVRSVEVGPVGGQQAQMQPRPTRRPPAGGMDLFAAPQMDGGPDARPVAVPLVSENFSRFTVTVEFLETKIAAPAASAVASAQQ